MSLTITDGLTYAIDVKLSTKQKLKQRGLAWPPRLDRLRNILFKFRSTIKVVLIVCLLHTFLLHNIQVFMI